MHYKDPNTNSVYFYETLEFVKPGLVQITDEEAKQLTTLVKESTSDENKATAVSLLTATDWVEFPSVTSPNSTPQLLNASDFLSYRSQLRVIAINPAPGNISWPTKPTAFWKM